MSAVNVPMNVMKLKTSNGMSKSASEPAVSVTTTTQNSDEHDPPTFQISSSPESKNNNNNGQHSKPSRKGNLQSVYALAPPDTLSWQPFVLIERKAREMREKMEAMERELRTLRAVNTKKSSEVEAMHMIDVILNRVFFELSYSRRATNSDIIPWNQSLATIPPNAKTNELATSSNVEPEIFMEDGQLKYTRNDSTRSEPNFVHRSDHNLSDMESESDTDSSSFLSVNHGSDVDIRNNARNARSNSLGRLPILTASSQLSSSSDENRSSPRGNMVNNIPHNPPLWIRDSWSTHCANCNRAFSSYWRKHHCRCCGLIYCSRCSKSKASIPKFAYYKPVRVCDPCYTSLTSSSQSK